MRVIAGSARGTKLIAPEGLVTRPTTDRIKETLFNILQNNIFEKSFLDLFCGSGAIGIEALSRGASRCTFVDFEKNAIDTANINLIKTKLVDKASVFKEDVYSFILKLEQKVDVIYLDPPYDLEVYNIIKAIVDNNILNTGGLMILEQPSITKIKTIEGLELYKEKDFKTTKILFYSIIKK